MRLFNFQIPDDLYDQLNQAAAASDRSASLYVREAIREKLAQESAGDVVSFRPPTAAADAPTARPAERDAILDRMRANMARAKGLI